jgi:hypothetical protein
MTNVDMHNLDWTDIAANLDREGYALLTGLLDAQQIDELSNALQARPPQCEASLPGLIPGQGERRVWPADVSDTCGNWTAMLHEHLAPIALRWRQFMAPGAASPVNDVQSLRDTTSRQGRVTLMSHCSGDFQLLQQDADADAGFPIQLVILLSDPVSDFTGGEFVMVEQRPRMQSRPIVLPLRKGDAALICASKRPFQGANGFYRVNMKHAISRVHSGVRNSVEVRFSALAEPMP